MTKSVVSSPAEEESLVTSKSDEESQSGVSESQESSSSTHDFVDEGVFNSLFNKGQFV